MQKGDAARPLSVYFLPVGLGRLINATLGKQVMPVNRKNATICQGPATVLGRKRAAPKGAAKSNREEVHPPERRTCGRGAFTMARKG
jgi:hypothetical protein